MPPRYDVIHSDECATRQTTNIYGAVVTGEFSFIPPAFLAAVNAALAEGATLVGGIHSVLVHDHSKVRFAQAVLYP